MTVALGVTSVIVSGLAYGRCTRAPLWSWAMSLYLNLLEPRPVRLTALAALASESQFAVGLSLRRSMTSLERMVGDIMIASCLSDIVSLMTRVKVPSRHGMAALRGGVGAVSAELTVKCKVHEVPFRRCPNGGVPASQDSKVPNGPTRKRSPESRS